jgi:hypothetical protein
MGYQFNVREITFSGGLFFLFFLTSSAGLVLFFLYLSLLCCTQRGLEQCGIPRK